MMSKRKHRTDGLTVKNDKMDNDKFRDFLSAAFLAAEETMEKGAAFYIFHSDNYSMWFREALMSTKDLELRETLIWNKDSLCLGRQDYQWKHEPCLYGWKMEVRTIGSTTERRQRLLIWLDLKYQGNTRP